MTYAELATEVNEHVSSFPVHTVIVLIIFDHAAKQEWRVFRKDFSRLLSSLAIAMCVIDVLDRFNRQNRMRE